MVNGAVIASLLCVLIAVVSPFIAINYMPQLMWSAGLSMLAVTLLALSVGTLTPIVLGRCNIDPAVASGVFITTANDICGVLIFFLMTTWLYIPA